MTYAKKDLDECLRDELSSLDHDLETGQISEKEHFQYKVRLYKVRFWSEYLACLDELLKSNERKLMN